VTDPRRRKLLVTLSIAGNLGMLGVFKYHGFFVENLRALTGLDLPALDVLLPVGISFYTFQTLSYTIDVYRGHLAPTRSLLDFAVYISFFPQLVAGPIVRARDFLPQLRARPALTEADFMAGIRKIVVGLTKKVLIADVLALHVVDPAFAPGASASGAAAWLAVYAYAIQIYCDFSGYSDIAIGSARLLGFRFLENFDAPYLARNVQDFWRRWHISLSTWLRDYLYIPLGGNRKGWARTQLNLIATMGLSGLWHGAAWKFVVWGLLHGAGLLWCRWLQARGWSLRGRAGHLLAILLTFHFAAFAFVPFRATDLTAAGEMFGRMLAPGTLPPLAPLTLLALGLALGIHLFTRAQKDALAERFARIPAPVAGVLVQLFLGLLMLVRAETEGVPFIYFQF
jgi:D-alanyl-lipoteichoic acid acyltransferase DltB (MBOAT superfamily)